MPGKKHWEASKEFDGVFRYEFSNYRWFFEFIQTKLLDYKTYIYRGQKDSSWLLESALDRELKGKSKVRTGKLTNKHLKRFKYATRGRIPDYFTQKDDDQWWALGQHYGLVTPLLDWTESPFVALFFSFEDEQAVSNKNRVVYAVAKSKLEDIIKDKLLKNEKNYVSIVDPLTSDNGRLVNQRGVFLSMPPNTDLENYIKSNVKPGDNEACIMKFIIPEGDRKQILKYLNRMNINHLTLFPDLIGASKYSNMDLIIEKY